jgi:hypothetical protein
MKLREQPKVIRMNRNNNPVYGMEGLDYDFWKARHLPNLPADFEQDALRLFDVNSKTNPKVNIWNAKKFRELVENTRVPVYRSDAHNNNSLAKNASVAQAKYQKQVYLAVGAQVMVRANLWTSAGVVNGSIGVVQDIIVHPDNVNENGTRDIVVMVELPGYKGPALIKEHPKLVPIRMCDSDFIIGRRRTNCRRTQVPLDLSWALTIHKSQGLTVGPDENIRKVIVDFGQAEGWAPGLMYVACSRVVDRYCLALDPIKVDEFKNIVHLPFYEVRRYGNLNSSLTSKKISEHIMSLGRRANG